MSDRNSAEEQVVGRIGLEITLRRFVRRIFSVRYRYDDPLDRHRASALTLMCLLFGILGGGGIFVLSWLFPRFVPQSVFIPSVILALLYLVIYRQVQRGHLRRAGYFFIGLAMIVPLALHIGFGFVSREMVYFSLAVPLISSALLLRPVSAIPTVLLVL